MTNLTPQTPAEGILKSREFSDSKSFHIPCDCQCENALDFRIDVDECITAYISATTKTNYWREILPVSYKEAWFVINLKTMCNDWYNRLAVAFTAIFKGYVETSTDIMLSPQQAINLSHVIKEAVEEYESRKQVS